MPRHEYADPRTAAFRATLDRLPDEVALAIGLRVFDDATLKSGVSCICGSAIREAIAREVGVDPDEVPAKAIEPECSNAVRLCVLRFGGTANEWHSIYWGVYDGTQSPDAPLIEEALFDRVMAAAENGSRRAR